MLPQLRQVVSRLWRCCGFCSPLGMTTKSSEETGSSEKYLVARDIVQPSLLPGTVSLEYLRPPAFQVLTYGLHFLQLTLQSLGWAGVGWEGGFGTWGLLLWGIIRRHKLKRALLHGWTKPKVIRCPNTPSQNGRFVVQSTVGFQFRKHFTRKPSDLIRFYFAKNIILATSCPLEMNLEMVISFLMK